MTITLPLLVSTFLLLFVKESPLILIALGKYEEFVEVIKYTAKVNKK